MSYKLRYNDSNLATCKYFFKIYLPNMPTEYERVKFE